MEPPVVDRMPVVTGEQSAERAAKIGRMNQSHSFEEPSTSVSLLQRARQGDPDGWRRLAQIYGPVVYGWARKCGCQSADAADVMQDTLAAVAGALDRFDDGRPDATFRGWLWTIARNKIRDRARSRPDERPVGGTAAQLRLHDVAASEPIGNEAPPTDAASDAAEARGRLVELLRPEFDPRSWRMFWDTAVVGRSPADVADEMGVSRWAVYKARARVLQRIRQEMKGLEPPLPEPE